MILVIVAVQLAAAPPAAPAVVPPPPVGLVTRLEPTTTPGAEPPTTAEQLALTALSGARLTVPVTVGAAGPFRFLVDTGADSTAVSRQLATRLALPRGRSAKLHSVTGLSSVATASISGLKVATRAVPDLNVPLLDAAHVGADGILGTDVLRSAMVRFDFKKGLLSIAPASRGRRLVDPDAIVVEARRRAGRLIVTEAELDGQRLTVVLDTGSEVSIGNEALRRALERRRGLSDHQPVQLRSVTGGTLAASYMFVRRLDLGSVRFSDLGIAFADAHTFNAMGLMDRPALLLGMNALQAFDSVTIDMAARKLRFSMPEGSMPVDNALIGTVRRRG